MIKAIIVDDEKKSRVILARLIETYCSTIKIMELCDSVDAAIKAIKKFDPDLVFLDIEMPFENGFALLEKIKPTTFQVIFITAYDHYAIKAIKYSALDYLLKPVDSDELIVAVDKMEALINTKPIQFPDFEVLLSNLKKGGRAKIAVPTFDGLRMIYVEEIIRCIADESYTEIILSNGDKVTVSRILKDYEDLLADLNFFRVHNSCLINLAHVSKYVKGDGGNVIMTNGESVEVARRKKNELLHRLTKVQW